MSLKTVQLPKNEKCAACGVKCVGAHWHYAGAKLPPAGRDGRVKFCTGLCCPLPVCQEMAARSLGAEELEWDDEEEDEGLEWDDVEWDESPSNDEDELPWEDVQG